MRRCRYHPRAQRWDLGHRRLSAGLLISFFTGLAQGEALRFQLLLHQAAGALGRLGLDEEVKVLRHQNPADQQKALLLPILPEKLDEQEAEALTVKERQGCAT